MAKSGISLRGVPPDNDNTNTAEFVPVSWPRNWPVQ